MVLEGVVTNILNRVLGMYVQNFDPKQLNIGILGGDVRLRNLELRKEALDQLRLPLNVVEGHLGELTLKIPFTNLRGAPVRVNVKDVFILAAPREDADYDAKEEEDRQHRVKMEKLESAELLKERNSEGMTQEEQQKQQSFVTSLTTAIIDNLQINVENIHIRYEDSISDPGHPFAAGITLREFSAQSTDENWEPKFIQGTSASSHKLAKLGALAIYWDTDTKLLGQGRGSDTFLGEEGQGLTHDELLDAFRDMITQTNDETVANHQFILKPVTGKAGIELDKTGRTDRAKMKANFMFDELGFVLDEDQYRDALMLVDLFHYFIRHQEYKKYQPSSKPKEDPRAWLAFAGKAVLDRIHQRNRKWSWEYFKERRDDRQRYIELFKKKKKEEKYSPSETEEMDKLERKLTYEDLRFWRSLARNQLRKENVGVKPEQKQTWGQWMFGYGKKQEEPQLTEEEKEKLYEAIDWDEKKAITEAVDMPKDTVKMQAYLSLRTGSFTLKRDPHQKATEILKLLFENFNTSFTQRPESFLAKLNLQGVRLEDGTTENSLFPQIITVKREGESDSQKRIEDVTDADEPHEEGVLTLDDEILQKRGEDAFFKVAFEKNPLDGSADNAIDLRLKGMEIIYNPRFVVEAVKFFKPPERHMESIGALLETAGQTVEGIRKQTRAGLEFALQEHKTINAKFDLQAPLIIIPDSVTQQSSLCMILDAGHASMTSDLVGQDVIKDVQSKQSQAYSDEDYMRLEELMYDKFKLKLESTQVLIGPSIEAARTQLTNRDDSKNMHLVERINMEFLVEICIVPKGSDLTRFRITGKLPVLHASISDAKYKNLMRLIDVAVPHFDDMSSSSQSARESSDRAKQSEAKIEEAATGRPRSKSFQFSAQEHELVLEEDEELQKPDTFKDATPGDQTPGVSIRRRNFEFIFVVEKLQGSLYRSDADGKKPDQLLAELVGQDFKLDFYQRPFDMTAEVSLRSLVLEDHIEQDPRPEFKKIISSDDPKEAEQALFQLKFVKVNPDSPEFQPKYDGIAMNLDISVSTINVVVTRKTILTLLDFILITFTNQNKEEQAQASQQAIEESSERENAAQETQSSSDRIRIKAELKTIAMILNNDGIRLATLSLNTATVGLTITGKTMRLGARLGNMSLVDDINLGASEKSSLRQLLTIQGDELADFTYETFDANSDTYPGHDSSIHLRSGSLKINFVTEPYRKIIEFFVKFGRMQAIFNAARQAAAEQASQMQERANRIQFDILVRTPIVVFPRTASADGPERDLLTAYLGEIYANNKFMPIDDTEDADISNQLSAGIRNVRLTSLLHYENSDPEELQLLQKVDLGFDVTYVEHKPHHKRPQLEARGHLSDINLRLTSQQLRLAMELSQSVTSAFQFDGEDITEQVQDDVDSKTTDNAKAVINVKTKEKEVDETQTLSPELGSGPNKWTKLDFTFTAGAVGLELITASDHAPIGDLERASLSKFSLNDTDIKLKMMSDDAVESELLIKSFTITDTRKHGTNKFRKIMSLINSEITQQFMANVTISGGKERSLMAIMTVDSPQVILSLDYLFALSNFISAGLPSKPTRDIEEDLNDDYYEDEDGDNLSTGTTAVAKSENSVNGGMSMAFRANLVAAQVILLANAAISSSEAIVLGMKQAIVAKQHATTLQVEKVGMFLCRMDKFDSSRLRILDDFSIATSLDVRSNDPNSTLTNIQVEIEPLVLRLSLRDILLVMQIISRASELSAKDTEYTEENNDEEPQRVKDIKKSARSHKDYRGSTVPARSGHSVHSHQDGSAASEVGGATSTILQHEEMNLHVGGIRVVLIGDLHELPMLDWSVKEFAVDVRDWTGALTADLNLDTFLNVYNFSKSAWEPLIEPWSVGFHVSRDQNAGKLSADVFSRKPVEITITSATIALASKSFQFLSTDQDVLAKPRGTDSPYRIRNYTGFDLNIWALADVDKREEGNAAKIAEGQEIPWRFEDPTTTRETLAPEGASGVVGIRLENSGFDSIDRIPINREGEKLYSLSPRKEKVLHRLLVEIKLGSDNVKYITFRSPLLVENNTYFPIELGIFNTDQGTLEKIDKIAPEQAKPSPVGAAFSHSVIIRPNEGLGYTWSDERLFWKDLVKRPSRTIMCRSDSKDSHPFYFQLNAIYNKSDPIPTIYPYMRLRLSAPVELENLLPYDFKYRIYDRKTKGDYANFLRKGGVSPIHVVNLSHLLLLSVDLQDTPFKQSEFAIINSPDREFVREKAIQVKDTHGLNLRLRLHYVNIPDSGGAFKVSIYSPYVVLNRTGMELDIRSKAFLGGARAAAGQGIWAEDTEDARRATPFMFSFQTDDPKNRALIKVGDSDWSKPQSFDAIGSVTEVKVPHPSGRSEMQLGVSVKQGEGKYHLTKVVTIAPRFVLRNNLGEELNIREPGSSDIITLKSGELLPLRFVKQRANQQLSVCYPGLNNSWSSPFYIGNVGRVHVKLAKERKKQQLMKVETMLEDATLFIHFTYTTHWPFSIRNESSSEFFFYQANPNVEEDDDEDRTAGGWRPIRYRLPNRSVMPYAWDYPASKNKDLILQVAKKERTVKLAEIGQQIPLKFFTEEGDQVVIDIDVVADGPKQELVLSDWKPSLSLYRQKTNKSTTSTAAFEVKEQDTKVTMSAAIRLAGVGMSLINSNLRELMYVTLRDIELKYNESNLFQTFKLTTKWIQIDNQLYGGIFPIILYPSVVPKTGKELETHPIFHAALTRVKDDSYGVLYIKYFTILLQQITVEVDEDFIFALLDFTKVPGASWSEVKEGKLCDEVLDIPEPQQEEQGQDIYFELLHLQPMQIDFSFVRTEHVNAEDTMAINSPFMFAFNVLTMSLGNVNDAPLRYNALMIENARIAPSAMIANVQAHYTQETLQQIHIVLGSADFLGNPVGLFNNISSGVADIFYEPYQGLVMTDRPQDLGLGLAKGASSFVKKSVFGFSDSFAKFTGSMAKGLAAASLDKEFQDQRRMSKSRNRPKHALYGITSGGNAFANSLASGIGGLARHPMEGAEKEGVGGFVKGMGKGFLGLATKTPLAAIDLASSVAEGIRNTTTVFDNEAIDRVRMPRFVGQDGIVRPYSQREALGQFWLKTLDNGRFFNEHYLAHLDLPGKDMMAVLTYNDILLVRTRKLQTEWDVPLKDIAKIAKERTGMNITLKEGRAGPFIPIEDESGRNFLYKQLAIAVNAYNEKHSVKA